jgi:hypothetical protein
MCGDWTLAVAILALIVSASALLIAWWQLMLQRDEAGGRGMIFEVRSPQRTVTRSGDVESVFDVYHVFVKLVGNDRHEVAVHLERDGRQLESGEAGYVESPAVLHRMTCEGDPIDWRFDLSPDAARDLWVVLTWAGVFGAGVRTDAFRRRLTEPQFEQWRWFRSYRARRRIQAWASRHRWGWIRRWLGKPRRLGAWRPYAVRELRPGQSPMHSQVTRGDD